MKRSDALKLIANQLDFLNNRFNGYRTNFTESELKRADVILITLEQAGMRPPCLPDQYCQALFGVYIDPNLNQ